MAELKTKLTADSVKKFLDTVEDKQKRADAISIMEMMTQASKQEPKMWGTSIVGYGSYHYKYESGHEGDMCVMGFSPRKQNFALYLPGGVSAYDDELKKLGKHKMGKGCLYINKLSDVDGKVLKAMLAKAVKLGKSK